MNQSQGGNLENEEVLDLSSEQSREIAEKVKARLVVDKATLLEELIELSREHLSLEETGRVHLRNPEQRKGAELVSLVLIGKSLARLGGLCRNDAADVSEISEATGQKEDVVIARLSDLRKAGVADSPNRGEHRLKSLAKARSLLLAMGPSSARREK